MHSRGRGTRKETCSQNPAATRGLTRDRLNQVQPADMSPRPGSNWSTDALFGDELETGVQRPVDRGLTAPPQEEAKDGIETLCKAALECQVCMDTVFKPIIQCPNGHLICQLCLPQVANKCPSCRAPIGAIRNRALEIVAATLSFPCRYNGEGCRNVVTYEQKEAHERVCRFGPIKCPLNGLDCGWTGPKPRMEDHLIKVHNVELLIPGCSVVWNMNKPGNLSRDSRLLSHSEDSASLITIRPRMDRGNLSQVIVAVQRIGTSVEASGFRVSVRILANGRRLEQTLPQQSTEDVLKAVIDNGNVFIVDGRVARKFQERGFLTFYIDITRAS